MSWVRPDQEILPQPSTHTSESFKISGKKTTVYFEFTFSGTPLVRPSLWQQKVCISRSVGFLFQVEMNTFMYRFTK